MKITLAQIKMRTANFEFNYENIVKNINDSDLIIFPQVGLDETGAKDMSLFEDCVEAQEYLFCRLAEKNFEPALLFGDILIKNGEIIRSVEGYFELDGKKIFVSDEFKDGVVCDLYVLSKNGYYVMGEHEKLVESVVATSDFVYISAIGMADENVYAGQSFVKNCRNELVTQAPLCEEFTARIDFDGAAAEYTAMNEQDVYKVLTFALKEYCDCVGFKKVILGLSGGIDSALTAALAAEALGAENVHGVMLPSMFSSCGSINHSLELAKNLNMSTENIPITPLFESFMSEFERKHDLAEENLQARLRGLILMFLSNRDGYLLLSTGNKSEVAMGYGTLYGDMAGGLNLLCDLTKTNVYKLSNWINRNGEIIPQEIIDKAPSAELRPNQKDQDSLPEYEVLDDIIEMYIEQGLSVEEISQKYDGTLVDEVIKKIYRSQFKRNQSCLGIRLTERAFCSNVKLPILQGMY